MLKTPTYRPRVHKDSSCGSVVVAAVLEIDTQEADMWMDTYNPKGWNGYTNVSHMYQVMREFRIEMIRLQKPKKAEWRFNYTDHPTAIFVQMEGPWEKKGWRSAYNYTHWALMLQNKIMDINNWRRESEYGHPVWLDKEEWLELIMPRLCDEVNYCTGHHIRGAYQFQEFPI